MKRPCRTAWLVLLAVLLLPACLGLRLGGGSDTKVRTDTTTLGQELIDLQRAKDAGIISDREYESQRKKILRSR